MGDSVERQGSNAQAKDPPPTPLLSQYSERSSCLVGGTVATAIGLLSCSSKVIGFRLRAAATSRHDTEQLGRQRADLFRVCLKKEKEKKKTV